MQGIGLRPKVYVGADGSGVVGHAGAQLLADLADATRLTAAHSTALRPLRLAGPDLIRGTDRHRVSSAEMTPGRGLGRCSIGTGPAPAQRWTGVSSVLG
ncbi:hypothetical protein ACWIG3_05955 [Streptomyces celluloflavus]